MITAAEPLETRPAARTEVAVSHAPADTTMVRDLVLPDGGGTIALSGGAGDVYLSTLDVTNPSIAALLWLANNALPPDANVIDVGACLGATALLLARRTTGTVYAFEPSPAAQRHLERAVVGNGAANVRLYPVALGAEPGRGCLFENPQAVAASHLVNAETLGEHAAVEVDVTTVDVVVREEGLETVDFMKIDVQGFEPDVLAGARATIARFRPAVFVEINAYALTVFRNSSPRALLEAMLDTFPHVYHFAGGQPKPIRGDDGARVFLHGLLVSPGCTDDLFCAFEPLPEVG